MKRKKQAIVSNSFQSLTNSIIETNQLFLQQAQKQVNAALTARNWVIGSYIFQYEQRGEDRALYGDKLYQKLSAILKEKGTRGLSVNYLYCCKDLYLCYPQIHPLLSKEARLKSPKKKTNYRNEEMELKDLKQTPPDILINRLSFSHLIELIKQDQPLKRLFYETMSISNNWSVRELQRAISSMLYERTGLSEKTIPEEAMLEGAIINHLQNFLLEMGKGFCFEERQKRITFDNTHYRIDLVFYHRILKCHVLIDLKMEDFTPADAGQMNMYLNYFRENEMQQNDAAPIGIILCAGNSETLARYATAGLSQKVFVSKYLTSLPSEEQLQELIRAEQDKSF